MKANLSLRNFCGFVIGLISNLLISSSAFSVQVQEKQEVKPNIIFILADDLGFGDLGIHGQQKIDTPHIDSLAKDGIVFSNHYSGSTVCAPSRSALFTGLHTGHTPIRGNYEIYPEGQYPMPDTLLTLGKLLKKAGYVNGAFGKWGLGMVETTGDPNHQGFDQFYGYLCQRYAHRYYPEYIWDNGNKVFLKGNNWKDKVTYAPEVIQQKALAFIEDNQHNPFFLFVPMIAPHAELAHPDGELLDKYRQRFGVEKPHVAPATWDYGPHEPVIPGYQSNPYPKATYAAMVEMVDRQVGQIIKKVEEMGLMENTIIIFSSDNGPHREGGHDPDFFNSNSGYRGYKTDLYEGGIKVPFIMKWKNQISPGSQSTHISAFWDVLPTIAEIIGVPITSPLDGISFWPSVKGEQQTTHEFLYWQYEDLGGKQALRMGEWKGVKLNVKKDRHAPVELYHLGEDPYEKNNVADRNPEIASKIHALMESAYQPNPVFKLFDEK